MRTHAMRDFSRILNNFPSTTAILRRLICTKTFFGRGSVLDPAESLQRSPRLARSQVGSGTLSLFPSFSSALASRFGHLCHFASYPPPNTNVWLRDCTLRTPCEKSLALPLSTWSIMCGFGLGLRLGLLIGLQYIPWFAV